MTTIIKKHIDVNMFAFLIMIFAGYFIPAIIVNLFNEIIAKPMQIESNISNIAGVIVYWIAIWFGVKYFLSLWMSKRYSLATDIKSGGLKESLITYIAWNILDFVLLIYLAKTESYSMSFIIITVIASIINVVVFYYALKRYIPSMFTNNH